MPTVCRDHPATHATGAGNVTAARDDNVVLGGTDGSGGDRAEHTETAAAPVGALVGDIGVNLHENGRQADLGYTLAAAHQGQGLATEAVQRVLDHLFDERGLTRVSAECDVRNTASARLLERVGFRREGHRRSSTWLRGEWTDDLLFGLLATDRRPRGAG